ncbi:MAG: SdrD B-like domain-containing protein [Pyrinomonadaceae bacterium]
MAASLACVLCVPAALCPRAWGGSLFADGAGAGDPPAAQGEGAARITTIMVGGRTLTGPNSAAQYRGGRLFLPVTSVARALGDRVVVDAAAGTVTVQRQTGVTADFSAQLRQVRENGSVVLAVGGAADIVFPPDPEGLMLPVEIVSALLDASVVVDEAARVVRVTRGDVRAETVRDGARHANWELYQLEYEYDFNRYDTAYNQGLTLRASGRVGDGRFGLLTNSTGGKGTDPSLLRNATFTFERPNGQRSVGGDFGTGTDLEFISATIRGAQVELPAGRARVTAFAGRAVSGVLAAQPSGVLPLSESSGSATQSLPGLNRLTYDTNVFGAYATFGSQTDGRARGHLFSFSSGALHFGSPRHGGELAAGSVRYASERSHLQGDFGFGKFKGTQREGVSVDGAAAAADVSGSFNLTDELTLQGRYAYTGANFLNPQSGLHDPIRLAAGGFTWRANRWVTASLNGSAATRPGLVGQGDRFVTSAFTLTPPRRSFPSVFFSHTQSSTPQVKAAAFTLLNVGREFSRWRLFFNATRVKTDGPADLNAQTGAAIRLGETGSLQLSQSFGSRGALGATADWQSQPLFDRRLNLSAGFGYYRGGGDAQHVSLSERLSATLRLPRESALQLSYLQTQGGPTVLVSLRGSLFKKRSAERAADAPVRELGRYGSFSGRVYQDVDADGRFDPKVDRAQAGVKVRVDGNRYVETDAGGLYHVEEVRAGEHNVYLDLLSVRADLTMLDGPQQSATLPAGRDTIVDFRLVRTGRVSGVVWFDRNENGLLDEGEQPLSDVRVVTGSGRDTLTDSNGAFAVGDLPPGEYALLLDEKTLPERTKSAGTLTVKVVAGTETGGVKFAVTALAPEVKRFSNK